VKKWLPAAALLVVGAIAMLHPPSGKSAVTAEAAPPARAHRRGPLPAPSVAVVYVAGAVKQPGLYRLPPGARAFAAVELAGGLRADADPAGVNLAEIVADGEEIAVPVAGQTRPRSRVPPGRKRGRLTKTQAPLTQIDLNGADATSLMQLPGVGKALAERIVQFREANGPFGNLDELADVSGMTPRRIDAVTPFLFVKQ
jgi:competence protein ComEA